SGVCWICRTSRNLPDPAGDRRMESGGRRPGSAPVGDVAVGYPRHPRREDRLRFPDPISRVTTSRPIGSRRVHLVGAAAVIAIVVIATPGLADAQSAMPRVTVRIAASDAIVTVDAELAATADDRAR